MQFVDLWFIPFGFLLSSCGGVFWDTLDALPKDHVARNTIWFNVLLHSEFHHRWIRSPGNL